MKRDMIVEAHSSFLGVPKDIALIMRKIINNENILRLVYHTDKRCLDRTVFDDISTDQLVEMLNRHQITNIPKTWKDNDKNTYVTVSFDDFVPNLTN